SDDMVPFRPWHISIARKGLQHAHAIVFSVNKCDVLADARYLHRLTQHLAAGFGHLLHRGLDVITRNDDRRRLPRPIGCSREKAAIDRTWSLRTALIRFGCGGNDIVAHLLPKHPSLPAKRVSVELRHALAVVV